MYTRVIDELKSGWKQTHWMWYIFPQVDGLGKSETARHFAIYNIEEASQYLKHSVLGQRSVEGELGKSVERSAPLSAESSAGSSKTTAVN